MLSSETGTRRRSQRSICPTTAMSTGSPASRRICVAISAGSAPSSSRPACRRWCCSRWAASRRSTGPTAVLVWTLSVIIGFIDAFVFAEIAGLHPKKSGGTAVHGATAWIRYITPAAPMSLWCNWLAWTPGARHRLRPRSGLPALDLLQADRTHQHVGGDAAQPQFPEVRAHSYGSTPRSSSAPSSC